MHKDSPPSLPETHLRGRARKLASLLKISLSAPRLFLDSRTHPRRLLAIAYRIYIALARRGRIPRIWSCSAHGSACSVGTTSVAGCARIVWFGTTLFPPLPLGEVTSRCEPERAFGGRGARFTYGEGLRLEGVPCPRNHFPPKSVSSIKILKSYENIETFTRQVLY